MHTSDKQNVILPLNDVVFHPNGEESVYIPYLLFNYAKVDTASSLYKNPTCKYMGMYSEQDNIFIVADNYMDDMTVGQLTVLQQFFQSVNPVYVESDIVLPRVLKNHWEEFYKICLITPGLSTLPDGYEVVDYVCGALCLSTPPKVLSRDVTVIQSILNDFNRSHIVCNQFKEVIMSLPGDIDTSDLK